MTRIKRWTRCTSFRKVSLESVTHLSRVVSPASRTRCARLREISSWYATTTWLTRRRASSYTRHLMIRKVLRSKGTTSIMLSSRSSQTSNCMWAPKHSTTTSTGSTSPSPHRDGKSLIRSTRLGSYLISLNWMIVYPNENRFLHFVSIGNIYSKNFRLEDNSGRQLRSRKRKGWIRSMEKLKNRQAHSQRIRTKVQLRKAGRKVWRTSSRCRMTTCCTTTCT